MIIHGTSCYALAAAVALLAAPGSGAAQQVDLTLKTDRAQFALGEPIVATVEITNRTNAPISVPGPFDPTYGVYQYWIRSPDGSLERFQPAWLDELDKGVNTQLAPGGTLTGFARLFHAGGGTPFRQPGVYRISVRVGTLQSPELQLSATAPANDRERTAAELLMDPDVTLFLLAGGGETLKKAKPNLEAVNRSYGDTALAPYADYALGVYYARDSRDFVRKAVRAADLPQARSLLERAVQAPVSSYFRQAGYQKLVRIALDLGDPGRAERYLQEYQSKPGREPDAARAIEEMKRAIREAAKAPSAR